MVAAGERIHVIGIAGSGAAGAALLLHHAGAIVDGCDAETPSPYTPPLDAAGIRHLHGHDPRHLAGMDRVAITPALRAVPGHAELAAAHAARLPVATWQELLGELMAGPGRVGVGITGTHGKSTTTALLGHLLIAAGLDPTVEVGAFIAEWGASVHPGTGAPFVVEADEFGDNFLNYHPAGAIVTNVEMDHPDYFADASAVMASFERFVRGMQPHPTLDGRLLVIAADDPGAEELTARIGGWGGRVVRYGPGGDVPASDVRLDRSGSSFTLFERPWQMSLAGLHNVANATAALVMARELGAEDEALEAGLRTFAGAGRRMELIADTAEVTIYDDYGHHPTEVRAALAAARQKVGPQRRLWAVFEPHMYSRTALLMDAFATAFADANEVVIADIFASRDTPEAMAATSAEALADAIERATGTPAIAVGDVEATTEYVADHVARGDAVLVMGAGKSYRIARGLAQRLSAGGGMIGVRSAVLGILLAIAVTIAYQGVVVLVEASGARDQPALILILLLAAFLGVLTAVATRTLRLPGATAPTALVLGWTLVPVILAAIPSAATQLFAGDAALSAGQALALATATVAAAVTLGVPAERR